MKIFPNYINNNIFNFFRKIQSRKLFLKMFAYFLNQKLHIKKKENIRN